MKRFRILVLLLSALCACSQSQQTFLVGVSQCSDDLWRETANREMLREASFGSDLSIEIRTSHDDSEEQIKDVEYFIDKKVDLLVVSPNEATSMTPVVSRAFRSGIPVVLFDRKIDSEEYSAYVGADNVQIGEQIGNYLSSLALHAGKAQFRIVVIRGTRGSTADVERYEGLVRSIERAKGIGIRIISERHADFMKESAYEAMCRMIGDGLSEDVDAIIAFNDAMAIGAYEALEELFPGGNHPPIVGVDALSGAGGGIDAIQKGIISASFIYPTGGDVVIDIVRKILQRNAFDHSYILNTALVTPDNVKILSLQRQELESKQSKLEEINERLRSITTVYGSQRRGMIALAILAGLILLLLLILLSQNRKRGRMNEILNRQNAKIQEQIQTLEDQNNQLTDLTKQLEEATRDKEIFYTNISHEFRTPLTLILGSTDLLSESATLQNEDKRSLYMIRKNGRKLLALINEILDFSACESHQMTIDYSDVELNQFLEGINAMFMDVARKKFIHFSFKPTEGAFDVQMDKNKLEKIYFNILSNAFKYVKEGGSVAVTLTRQADKGQAAISVFNSDSFISEAAQRNIFKMFYTGSPMGANSSGIGLALTKSLVDVLSGDISIESDESTGTTFTVTLPYRLEENAHQEPDPGFSYASRSLVSDKFSYEPEVPAEVSDPDDGNRETILVIEDNQDLQRFLKTLLSPDYRVLQAFNGRDGLDKVYLYHPDLIISDIMLPVMDGYDVCRKVKANEVSRHIPIVLLTACALDEQRSLGYEVGADAFLQKPFNAEVLKTRIRNLFLKKNALLESAGYSWIVGKEDKIPPKGCDILDKIVQYVTAHIEETISIDDLAEAVGTSRANLYKKIKEVTDYSPIDLVNLLKIKKALDLVLYRNMTITEAAYEMGFNSLSYFSRTFVKYYKVPPRTWIKEHYGDISSL